MRKLFAGLIVAASVLPLSAGAQSTTDVTAQIQTLLAQIAQLQAQISAQGATSTPQSTPPSSVVPNASIGVCPSLTHDLSAGASGADVANLQAFLAGQGIFKNAITGFFGKITATAVGQWQESHGIVFGGTASSTGFGVVGPKTRAAIASACGVVSGKTQCIPTQPPLTLCSTQWQPVADKNGCTMYYQCVISLPNASTTSNQSTTSNSGASCPFVQKPNCTGTISPFTTDGNGCVTAYVCSVQ